MSSGGVRAPAAEDCRTGKGRHGSDNVYAKPASIGRSASALSERGAFFEYHLFFSFHITLDGLIDSPGLYCCFLDRSNQVVTLADRHVATAL